MSKADHPKTIDDLMEIGHSERPIHLLRETEHELILARQKLDLANRMRAEFLSKMSHEFRTPMTAIVGMTDLLLLGEASEEQRDCLGTIRDAADNLMQLLNNVCDYARVEAGTLDFEWTGFRLRSLLEETVRPLAASAHAKGLELVVSIKDDVPDLLVADPRRVAQIIHNLIDSSIRLTRDGEVLVEIERMSEIEDEVSLRLMVRDTGAGIASEDQQRILLPFMGSDHNFRRQYPLSPLGLPLTASLLSALGGRLTVQSELGSGTCFDASLRLLKLNRNGAGCDHGARWAAPALSNQRVLIVDRNATARKALAEMFLDGGLRPTAVADLETAADVVDGAADDPFAIVLIDAEQAMLAPSFLVRIRRERQTRPVILLMLRSDQNSLDTEQCELLGVTATLRKPVFARELIETLLASVQGVKSQGVEKKNEESMAVEMTDKGDKVTNEISAAIGRLGGDVELYKELIQCFLDDSSGLIPKIRDAVERRQPEALHRAAHGFKGLAASCGAGGVVEAAERLEQLGRAKQLDEFGTALVTFESAMNTARGDLAPYYPARKAE